MTMQNIATKLEQLKPYVFFSAVLAGMVKIMHWPGANLLLILSLSFLAMIYLFIGRVTVEGKFTEKMVHYAIHYGSAYVCLGALFKIMHWPGAHLMLIVGLVLTAGGYLADFIFFSK